MNKKYNMLEVMQALVKPQNNALRGLEKVLKNPENWNVAVRSVE